jgi:branched-chain amino acid transport system permease protein
MRDTATSPTRTGQLGGLAKLEALMPVLVLAIGGGALPLLGDSYLGVIGTRACIYWVLVSGLNLVVGFAG